MPNYESSVFSPPTPVAAVILRNTATAASVSDVPMLLDTGADVTLLPSRSVVGLNLPRDSCEQYELMGFDGSRSLAPAVRLDLVLLN